LSKLGVGISKADLKAKSFKDITDELAVTFAGSATASANTFQGSMDKLGVASANVKEIIGTGLIDALKGLADEGSIESLSVQMQTVAIYVADTIRGIGVLVGHIKTVAEILNKIPFLDKIMQAVAMTNPLYSTVKMLHDLGEQAAATAAATGTTAQALAHMAELQDKYTASTLGKKKKLTAEELKALAAAQKALAAKKLAAAIDKANLALGKGGDVFDMEKIQLQAAEINQAQQLGKVTNQAQLLQITNDLARLQLKKDIIALEDAIASKDEAAIIAATAKLNADLKIVGALTGQELKMKDIKSILDSIVPKDLINIANLDAAIAKLKLIGAGTGTGGGGGTGGDGKGTGGAALLTPGEINKKLADGSFVPVVPGSGGSMGGSSRAGDYAPSGFPGASGNSPSVNLTFYNNFGVVGDPNSAAEVITEIIRNAVDRGTLRGV
jgi:hypothetical protein